MQNLIANLVNKELKLDEDVKAELEKKFEALDLDYILMNPKAELAGFALKIMEEVFKKYSKHYILSGVEFSDAVENSKKPLEIVNA